MKRFPLLTAGKHSSQTQLSSSHHGSAEVTGQTWRAGTAGQTGKWRTYLTLSLQVCLVCNMTCVLLLSFSTGQGKESRTEGGRREKEERRRRRNCKSMSTACQHPTAILIIPLYIPKCQYYAALRTYFLFVFFRDIRTLALYYTPMRTACA